MRTIVVVAAVLALAGTEAWGAPLRSGSYLTYELRGEETVDTDGRHLESISVFSFELTEAGDVAPHEAWVPDTAEWLTANARGRTILVTIVNHIQAPPGRPTQVHNGELVHQILSDPARRAEHIRQLVAVANLAHGIEIDYERLKGKTRDLFTLFIRELRAALPPSKKLHLVIPPKTDNLVGDGGRAIDWRAVEPFVGYIRIMAYYYAWATSPHGPILPFERLERLANYALYDPEQGLPRDKVGILLSFYGWDWPMPEGTRGLLVTYDEAMAIAARHGITPIRDPQELTLHFHYVADDGVEHEIWVDDFESQKARIELLRNMNFPHIDFWHLNTGDRRLWDWIAQETAPDGSTGGPIVETDVDGDGAADVGIFRPSNGRWRLDANEDGVADTDLVYGRGGDVVVPGDWNGDGVSDLAVYRPKTGRWFLDWNRNGGTDLAVTFGFSGDVPVPGDWDGDGTTDVAVFHPPDGSWHFDWNEDALSDLSLVYGRNGDVPVPGDWNGDGRTDMAVYRPSTRNWFIDWNHNGGTDLQVSFGGAGEIPVPADWDGDGATDVGTFRPSDGMWRIDFDENGVADLALVYGRNGDYPVAADYDGDGRADLAVFRPSTGNWFLDWNRNGGTDLRVPFGGPGDVPLRPNGWVLDALGIVP